MALWYLGKKEKYALCDSTSAALFSAREVNALHGELVECLNRHCGMLLTARSRHLWRPVQAVIGD